MEKPVVWVFNGANWQFPSGVFSSRHAAEAWISNYSLTGVLTGYPLDVGAYDWAVAHGSFAPSRAEHGSSRFVATFSDAGIGHYHYEDGTCRE